MSTTTRRPTVPGTAHLLRMEQEGFAALAARLRELRTEQLAEVQRRCDEHAAKCEETALRCEGYERPALGYAAHMRHMAALLRGEDLDLHPGDSAHADAASWREHFANEVAAEGRSR